MSFSYWSTLRKVTWLLRIALSKLKDKKKNKWRQWDVIFHFYYTYKLCDKHHIRCLDVEEKKYQKGKHHWLQNILITTNIATYIRFACKEVWLQHLLLLFTIQLIELKIAYCFEKKIGIYFRKLQYLHFLMRKVR